MPTIVPLRHHILTYLYLLLAAGMALFSAFILRDTYRLLLINAELHRYTIHANVLFTTFIVVGIGGLVFLVAAEHYFRVAPDMRTQFRRFLQLASFPLLVTGIAHLGYAGIAFGAAQFVDTFRLSTGLAECLVGGLLLFLGFKPQSGGLMAD